MVDVSRTSAVGADDVRAESIQYARMKADWPMIDALYGGTSAMREAVTTWLPQRMKEPKQFYDVRLRSSFLYAALKDTVDGIVTKPFSQDVSIVDGLVEPLLAMVDDFDGAGTPMHEVLAAAFREGWKYGLCHLVVDYPTRRGVERSIVEGEPEVPLTESSAAEAATVRPRAVIVSAKDMLGWRHETRDGVKVLTQVRFLERVVEEVGDFGQVEVEQVRVITEATWAVYRRDSSMPVTEQTWQLFDSGVNSIGVVPVVTFYVEQTGLMTATPPLLDLAWLNVAHWQSSSLQRNSLDIARIPILVKAGFQEQESGDPNTVGASTLFTAPDPAARAYYCEHSGAAIAAGERDLQSLREQMEVLGLQPWMQSKGNSTATGVASNDEKAESRVQSAVRALERAALAAFELAARWAKVELPTDFAVDVFDDFGVAPERAQDVDFLIRMVTARKLDDRTFLEEMKRRKVLAEEVDVDEVLRRLEAAGPALGDLAGALSGLGGGGFGGAGPARSMTRGAMGGEPDDEAEDDEPPSDSRVPRRQFQRS